MTIRRRPAWLETSHYARPAAEYGRAEGRLVETAKKDVALAAIGIEKIRPARKKVGGIKLGGRDDESRLAECYDDGGEALGELLVKLGLKAAG